MRHADGGCASASCTDLSGATRAGRKESTAVLPAGHRLNAADQRLTICRRSLRCDIHGHRCCRDVALIVLGHHGDGVLSCAEKNLGVDRVCECEIHRKLIDINSHEEDRILRARVGDDIHRRCDAGVGRGTGNTQREVIRSVLPRGCSFVFCRRGWQWTALR